MIEYTPLTKYDIFGFRATPESIATILAFTVLLIYAYSYFKKEKINKQILDPKEFAKFAFIIITSSILVGRAWFYFIEIKWKGWSNVIRFIDLRNAVGLVSIGMVVGGALGLLIYILFVMKKEKNTNSHIIFSKLVDIITPAAALYIFIFRLFGCSIQGICSIGTKTTVPWALNWIEKGIIRHPVSFYLALSGLFIFIILRLFFSYEKTKKSKFGKRSDGEVALWFLLLYCFNRFFIEFFRVNKAMYGPLNMVQWICLVGIIITPYILADCYYTLSRYKINSYQAFKSKQKELLKLHSLFLLKETIKKIMP